MAFYASRSRLPEDLKAKDKTIAEHGDLQCSVAATPSEVLEALTLVHRQGIRHGHAPGDKTGIRFTKYHLMPTTTILVVKSHGEIVATCSLIADSALGMPMDRSHDLSRFRRNGAKATRLAEVSCLAVSDKSVQAPEVIVSYLLRYAFHFARHCVGANYLFASITDADMRVFGHTFQFSEMAVQPISEGVRKVSAVCDVDRYFASLDPKAFRRRGISEFLASRHGQHFPTFDESRQYNPMQKTLLRFVLKTNPCDVLGRLTLNELAKVCDTYRGTGMEEDLLALWPVTKAFLRKRSPRLTSNLEGAIKATATPSPVQICNVSETGLSGYLTDDISRDPPAGPFELSIYTSAGKMKMQAEIVWIRGAQFGAKIVNSPGQWADWLQSFSGHVKAGAASA